MEKSLKMVLVVGVLLVVPSFTSAAVIFQDNFDNCTNCMATSNTGPAGWTSWYGPYSATVGGVTHNSGEITSPGRGGGGKSFKIWRAGSNWEGYAGALNLWNIAGTYGSHSDIYMRYYVKLPTSLDLSQCSGSNYLKLWRLNTSTGKEIYLNIQQYLGSTYNTGTLQIYPGSYIQMLSNKDLKAIWDNNWHSWEWHINLNSGTLEFWIDGVRKFSQSGISFGGGTFDKLQHFSMGNHATGCSWQSSWQAMDIDDFVLSTTYVGPDGSTGGGTTPPPPTTDTTAPVISNPQPSATLGAGTVSTTMRVTTNENATCKYGTSNVAYTSLPSTFSTTGATTHSTSLTGLTNGSSATYYVRCTDSSGNASTASTPITVAVSTTQPSTSNIFFQDNFDN